MYRFLKISAFLAANLLLFSAPVYSQFSTAFPGTSPNYGFYCNSYLKPTLKVTNITPKSGTTVTGIITPVLFTQLVYPSTYDYRCRSNSYKVTNTITMKGGPLDQSITTSEKSIDTSGLLPGRYSVKVTRTYTMSYPTNTNTSISGQTYSVYASRITYVDVVSDEQAPELTFKYPIQGLTLRGESRIKVEVDDESGVRDIHFLAGNRDLGIYDAETTEIPFDTRLFPDGILLLRVRAVDNQNNPIVASITVTIDNVDDAPEISFIDLFDNQGVSGSINVRTDSFDDRGIEYVKFYVDGTEVATDLIAPYDAFINTEDYKNGPHQVAAVATDSKGETTSASTQLIFQNGDITPPIARITSLFDKARVSGEIAVKTKVEDASGIEKVEFYLGTTLLETKTLPPYELSYDTTQVANGIYNLGIVAYDRANNIQTDNVVLIIENGDALNASVFITKPSANSVLAGYVELEALAVDNVAIKEVRFLLDDKILGSTKLYPYRYIFDTTGFPDGAYTITAQAIDYEENVGIETIAVTINNTNPDFIYNEQNELDGNPTEMIKGYTQQVIEQINLLGLQKIALTRSTKKEHKRAFNDTMKTLLKQIKANKKALSKRQAKKSRRLAKTAKKKLRKAVSKGIKTKALERIKRKLERIIAGLG